MELQPKLCIFGSLGVGTCSFTSHGPPRRFVVVLVLFEAYSLFFFPPSRAGYLRKRRETDRWLKRWCVLTETSLTYFHKPTDENPSKIIQVIKKRGSHNLEAATNCPMTLSNIPEGAYRNSCTMKQSPSSPELPTYHLA